jgi:hypothetical protein
LKITMTNSTQPLNEKIIQTYQKNIDDKSSSVNDAIVKTLAAYAEEAKTMGGAFFILEILIPEIGKRYLETCLDFAVDAGLESFELMCAVEDLTEPNLKNLSWHSILDNVAAHDDKNHDVFATLSDEEAQLLDLNLKTEKFFAA